MLFAVTIAACIGSNPTEPTSGGSSCSFQVSLSSGAFGPSGGTATASVTANADCAWQASATASWVVLDKTSGTGAGTVNVSVGTFEADGNRVASFTVAGKAFAITQAGCTLSLSPTALDLGWEGGSGDLTITTPTGCGWMADAVENWMFLPLTGGTGSGRASYLIAPYDTSVGTDWRRGQITIRSTSSTAVQRLSISELPDCHTQIGELSQSHAYGADAGTGHLSVNTESPTLCPWNAISHVPWILITASGGAGPSDAGFNRGDGEVYFTVTANPGAPRTGTLRIGERTFSVNQAGR